MLAGRAAECARLDRLLAAAHTGQSGVVVLRGEPGIGKTALLGYAADRANGWRIARAAGVEAEMELPFSGLHQLFSGLLVESQRLPPPQHDALTTAFGMSTGTRPDRFLIGLAVLNLLSEAAERLPLLCVVDDAQWLDRSSLQVLGFVARRLQAESVVMMFGERESAELEDLARLPDLRLRGVSDAYARELLAAVIKGPLDPRVRDRILAETHGNPLALLELPHDSSPARLAGGFGLPDRRPLRGRIESSFRARVQQLPADTQQLLLTAAADPTGEPALLWRAAAELGITSEAVTPAEADDLLRMVPQVTFRHPLLRSSIYHAAPIEERRAVHAALAAATDADTDPDRRTWHRAHAASRADEEVASELERSAGRARGRGGLAAAAAFLQRAAALTPDAGRRARRALEAARAQQLSGAPQAALALLGIAAAGPLDERDHAMLQRLHGQIALDLRRGATAIPLLLDAAKRLEAIDLDAARDTYLDALQAASVAGRLGGGVRAAAEAARRAPQPDAAPRAADLLLVGLAVYFTNGYAAGAPPLKQALSALHDEDDQNAHDVRWPWSARRVAPDLFNEEAWQALATRNVHRARDAGALGVLPLALNALATLRIFEGELDAASALLEEADAIAEATGNAPMLFGSLMLAGCRGDKTRALLLIEASEAAATARGEGVLLSFSEHARAVLYNGLGEYEAALTPAQSASGRDELMTSVWSLPELVEAASRCGRTHSAAAALERLCERTRAAGTELALGVEACSRALLSEGQAAELCYSEAIERLSRTRIRLTLARAHLLYGEWLRREGRRVDARVHLRSSYDTLTAMGVNAFAERARRELVATGETARKRTVETGSQLTAQQAQIARLAADGLTNPEISSQLFISPRTVEWHLRKVFTKLNVGSRKQLGAALPAAGWVGSPTSS